MVRVKQGASSATFILIGKQAEQVIQVKANVLFEIARRTNEMVPPQLKNIIGKKYQFTVELNLSQLHNNKISFNVNQVNFLKDEETVQIERPKKVFIESHTFEGQNLADEPKSSPSKALNQHTGLSPQTAGISLNPDYMSIKDLATTSDHNKRKNPILIKQEESEHSSSQSNEPSSSETSTSKPSKA